MMKYVCCLMLFYICVYWGVKRTAIDMINIAHPHFRFHEKHYVSPSRWMRKHVTLTKKDVPKYAYFRLYVALVLKLMIPLSAVIFLVSGMNPVVCFILLWAPLLFLILDFVLRIMVYIMLNKK